MILSSAFAEISAFFSDKILVHNLATILLTCFGVLLLATLLKLLLRNSGVAVSATSAALDILILIVLYALISQFYPVVQQHLPTLPFASFDTGSIRLLAIPELDRSVFKAELVNMIILVFLFGLAEDLLPEGKNIVLWLLLRVLACGLVCGVLRLIQWIFSVVLPGFIQVYASAILLILLGVFLAVTVLKWLIGLILGVSGGPVLGAVYTFFISNIIGKQLAKAALASGLIILLLYVAWKYDMCTLSVDQFPTAISILTLVAPVLARYFIAKLH